MKEKELFLTSKVRLSEKKSDTHQTKRLSDKVQLYRAISKFGYVSRTQAIELIRNGEICVDGKMCNEPQKLVSQSDSKICHNGRLIKSNTTIVLMLYKPKNIITSRKDEQGRPTVYSLIPEEYHKLHCVGRLDYATTGLLLLTNNTQISSWLTDPVNEVLRVYLVTVRGLVTEEKAALVTSGITDNGDSLKCDAISIRKSSRRESHLVITLSEGKNREIRRLCAGVGHEVTRLKRVSYGPLTLGNLKPGEYRNVGIDELNTAFPETVDFTTTIC